MIDYYLEKISFNINFYKAKIFTLEMVRLDNKFSFQEKIDNKAGKVVDILVNEYCNEYKKWSILLKKWTLESRKIYLNDINYCGYDGFKDNYMGLSRVINFYMDTMHNIKFNHWENKPFSVCNESR